MTEGDSHSMMGTMPMYYVTAPNETGRQIQSMLDRNETQEPMIPIAPILAADETQSIELEKKEEKQTEKQKNTIGTREVSHDVKSTIRDVLR